MTIGLDAEQQQCVIHVHIYSNARCLLLVWSHSVYQYRWNIYCETNLNCETDLNWSYNVTSVTIMPLQSTFHAWKHTTFDQTLRQYLVSTLIMHSIVYFSEDIPKAKIQVYTLHTKICSVWGTLPTKSTESSMQPMCPSNSAVGENLCQFQLKFPDNVKKTSRDPKQGFTIDHCFCPVPANLFL